MIKALGWMKRFDFAKEKLTFRLQLGVFVFWLNTQCKPLQENGKRSTHILAKLEERKLCFHIDDVHGIIAMSSKAFSYVGFFFPHKFHNSSCPVHIIMLKSFVWTTIF
jgi:hypothetical protein